MTDLQILLVTTGSSRDVQTTDSSGNFSPLSHGDTFLTWLSDGESCKVHHLITSNEQKKLGTSQLTVKHAYSFLKQQLEVIIYCVFG